MPRVHFIKKARKDYPNFGIQKGDSYYRWSFRFGGTKMSKTHPKPSQLTQSEYLSTAYSIQETFNEAVQTASSLDDLRADIEDAVCEIEMLRDETEGKLDNMPDQLRDADTGQLLQERVDALDAWQSDLENVDTDEPTDDDGAIYPEDSAEYLERFEEAKDEIDGVEPDLN